MVIYQDDCTKGVKNFNQAFLYAILQEICYMKILSFLLPVLLLLQLSGCSQSNQKTKADSRHVGGSCEGCEAIFETPIPFEKLRSVDTLPDYYGKGAKMEISGVVYKKDGKTPASDVVIYVYHTDQTGIYPTKGGETGWGKRHGYIRGWVKTDKNGMYKFYTLKPVAYPNRRDPAHIHVTIKEPDKNEYWIDEYLFDDDPLLTKEQRNHAENRGGNGIIKLVTQSNGIATATRNIYLGKNIPGYY